jgi:hypothetical protein
MTLAQRLQGLITSIGADIKDLFSRVGALEQGDSMPYAKRVDIVSDLVIYKGEAAVGSADSSASWRIWRLTFNVDGDVTEEWASGNANFDKVWDDRALLSYW